jgi:hypothetical protein
MSEKRLSGREEEGRRGVNEISISLSPVLLTLKPLGETVGRAGEGSAGDRMNETEDALDTVDVAARSSASSRSRRSLMRVSLGSR